MLLKKKIASKSIFCIPFEISWKSRFIFKNFEIKKNSYKSNSCFKNTNVIKNFKNFVYLKFVFDFNLLIIYEINFLNFSLIHCVDINFNLLFSAENVKFSRKSTKRTVSYCSRTTIYLKLLKKWTTFLEQNLF